MGMALLLFLLSIAPSLEARQAYLFDSLNSLYWITQQHHTRHHLSLSASQFERNLSAGVHAGIDLRILEVEFKYVKPTLTLIDSYSGAVYGGEVARYFIANNGIFGRLGAGYYLMEPKKRFIRVSLQAGNYPTSASQWSSCLAIYFYFSMDKERNYVSVEQSLLRTELLGWKSFAGGGKLQWTKRTGYNQGKGVEEHMTFGAGPVVDYALSNLQLHLDLMVKIWVDRQQDTATSYPVKVGPIANLTASYSF